MRDQPAERVQIVELGAGAGRFAHGLARELRRPFTYTLTDFAESQLEDWRKHAALEGFAVRASGPHGRRSRSTSTARWWSSPTTCSTACRWTRSR